MEIENPWASEQSPSVINMSSSDRIPIPLDNGDSLCPDCEASLATSFCPKCRQVYCDECWQKRMPHMKRLDGHVRFLLDGTRANDSFETYEKLAQALTSHLDEGTRENLHLNDYATLWFGLNTSNNNSLSFEEHPRFGDLMRQHRERYPNESAVYPCLVSFIGGTGAGKSTLIQMLIRQLWNPLAIEEDSNTPVPIVGDQSTIPTSSDVHLYYDPIRDEYASIAPLLFADCEGFDGGNQSSAARMVDKARKSAKAKDEQWSIKAKNWVSDFIKATMRTLTRPLSWSESVKGYRQVALEQLFPRLLYNFSDVIVYVLAESESRKIGKVLGELIKWSEKSAVAAINRSSLPSLIVVLNQSDTSGTDWDPKTTTNRILQENEGIITNNAALAELKAQLERLGRNHDSLKDILRSSYNSVEFIRIPRGKDLSRLASQLQILRQMIRAAANNSQQAKEATNTLLNSEHQDAFYHLAFDHFSKYENEPFDYMETFFSIHPLPINFANTLVDLFRATQKGLAAKHQPSSEALAQDFLKVIVPVVSSAVAIDLARSSEKLPGTLFDLIQGERPIYSNFKSEMRQFSYEKQMEMAIQRFLDTSCECAFTTREQNIERRCVNNRAAHENGRPHQDAQGNNIGLGTDGSFEENPFHQTFIGETKGWAKQLYDSVTSLECIRVAGASPDQPTLTLDRFWRERRKYIRDMYKLIPDLGFPDLSGCFWCLRDIPTERLSCGHWICESCILQIGEPSRHDDRLHLLRQCDRHSGERILDPPFEFLHIPQSVGRRLLSLGEGGVGGILELYFLKAVQQELGEEICLQDCFDLIGGTDAGGVIALGLAIGQWRVSEAIEKFRELASRAFSERTNSWFSSWFSSQRTYKSENLKTGIDLAFGVDGNLPMTGSMSQKKSTGNSPTRVFVTTSVAGRGGEILTNYLKPRDVDMKQTQRTAASYTYSHGLETGEAAKATLSILGYFDPFRTKGGVEYIGGDREFSSPKQVTLSEAQRLWPHAMKLHPDVLVSICSGFSDDDLDPEQPGAEDNSSDCEITEEISSESFGQKWQRNPDWYIRMCLKINASLRHIDEVWWLKSEALQHLNTVFFDHNQQQTATHRYVSGKVNLLVRRLISTVFYFHPTSPLLNDGGEYAISGCIRCRYRDTSDITKAFGRKIKDLRTPRFVLGTSNCPSLSIDEKSFDHMETQGTFLVPVSFRIPTSSHTMDIKFTADEFPAQSISGCPLSISSGLQQA